MLRGMVLENFVDFKERCKFDFSKTENGPYLFVGSSSTGKTVALELIRRCMDCKINSSLTKRSNTDENAYVFCEFKIDTPCYGPTVITGMIVEGKHKSIQDSISEDEEYEVWNEMQTKIDTKFHKVIMYCYNSEIKFCSKTYIEKENGHIVDLRMNRKLSISLLEGILDTQTEVNNDINKGIEERFTNDFVKKVVQQIEQEKEKPVKSKPELWRMMEENFVGILTMRGLGTFQWTKSPFIEYSFKSMNYEGTCAQAEIIAHLLDNEFIDKEEEDKIFKYLTGQKEIKFWKTTSPTGFPVINVERDESTFPLLKTSLGIIEAKQFSLLMAHKKFKTICLEEPDRGMHPHMIERMKEVLHQESLRKTVIVATHSPYLLDSRSLDNTFIFFKQNTDSFAENIGVLDKCGIVRKMIEVEDLKRLLFSSHVLFVEGKSDKIVLQSIFTHIFLSERNRLDTLSYEIVRMGGKYFVHNLAKFCKSINIKHCFILDRDACKTTNQNNSSDDLNTFFWTKGELEDFLLDGDNAVGFKAIKKCFGELDVFEDEELTEKKKIKIALNGGLSMVQSKSLANFIKDFQDIELLRKFLKEKMAFFK